MGQFFLITLVWFSQFINKLVTFQTEQLINEAAEGDSKEGVAETRSIYVSTNLAKLQKKTVFPRVWFEEKSVRICRSTARIRCITASPDQDAGYLRC